MHRLQAVTCDFQYLAVLPHDANFLGRDFQHHSSEQIAFVTSVDQGLIDGVLLLARVDGQGDEFFGATVDLTQLIVQDAATQRLISNLLVIGFDGGVHIQATGVAVGAVLGKHELARHLRHIVGMDGVGRGEAANLQFLDFGSSGLLGGDEAVVLHTLDDVELA